MSDTMTDIFGPVISKYTTQDGIDDGLFIDVSEMAREAGLKFKVVVHTNLYHTHVVPSDEAKEYGQSVDGRLWDVLFMLRMAAGKATGSFIKYEVAFSDGPNKHRVEEFFAGCGPLSDTDPTPVITVYLPEDY